MPFSLIFFDYDGVLIDSLGDAISVGGDFCRSISHDRVPTKETIGALDIMTYHELARSIGLSCMIGDSVSDIRYAKRAGVQSIAATWGWQRQDKLIEEHPDFIVDTIYISGFGDSVVYCLF